MDITTLRIGQRVAVDNPFDGPYTGTITAILDRVGPEGAQRPGVYLKDCVDNPSGRTWAYADDIERVID